MARFVANRLAQSVVVLLLATSLAFALQHLSGDPVQLMLGDIADRAEVERMRHELGLDRPLLVQYARWFGKALRGDLGESIHYQQPAVRLVVERLPASAVLALAAIALALVVGIPLGIFAAVFRGGWIDLFARLASVSGQSIPSFWLAMLLIVTFSVRFGWLPTSGYGTWKHLVLPALTLSTLSMARITRLLRSSLLDVLAQDYIRTARGKGLGQAKVVLHHALRNASLPVLTVVALQFGAVFGGAVITETIFAWPGVGRLSVDAALSRDYPLFQSIVVLMAVVFVLANLTADILYALLDPRIRYT